MPAMLFVAASLACQLVEPGSIEIDGMLDDWEGVDRARAGGKDKDRSFDVRCVYDGATLALSIDVRDDKLVRLYKPKAKLQEAEDHLELSLSAGGTPLLARLWPGTERHQPRRQVIAKKKAKKAPAWLAIEDSQQPKGWSIELELPVAKLGGWSAAVASLDASVVLVDADSTEDHTTDRLEHQVSLALGDAPDLYEGFLRAARLKKKDVVLDQKADVDGTGAGDERVIAGGTVLGVIGESYGFVELPGEVKKVQIVDLGGDGKQVLTVLRQSGGGGTRDVVAIWGAPNGKLEQLFAVEIRKEYDGNVLESTWSLRARKKAKKDQELVVQAKTVVGWDEDTFEEDPADDAEPIHLPWNDARTGGVYWLDGTTMRSKVLKKKGS